MTQGANVGEDAAPRSSRHLPAWSVALLKYLAAIVVLGFVVVAFQPRLQAFRATGVALSAGRVAIALVLGLGLFLLNFLSWHLLTGMVGAQVPARSALRVWVLSQLGKYIPGKVWMLVGRAQAYRAMGRSGARVGSALVLEMILRLAAGLALFLATWAGRLGDGNDARAAALVLVLLLILVEPHVFGFLFDIARRMLRVERVELTIRGRDVGRVLLVELAAWSVSGLGLHVLTSSVHGQPWYAFPTTAGAVALAGVVGFLAVFVPSGLGVREGVLVALFSRSISTEAALHVSILARIYLTVVELILVALVLLFRIGRDDPEGSPRG